MLYKLLKRWKKKSLHELLPPPVKVSHGEYSMILSAQDEPARPNEELLKLAIRSIQAASEIDLSFLQNEMANLWPGEHYRLLAGFAQTLKPQMIIEIGTSTGLSARAMLPYFSGTLLTFDVQKLHILQEERLEQVIGDLSEPQVFEKYRPFIEQAGFIFIDATHDGVFEKTLLDLLSRCSFKKPVILFLDDIRVWTMLKMWREIRFPKLDLTSFGHWSGSGIVQLA